MVIMGINLTFLFDGKSLNYVFATVEAFLTIYSAKMVVFMSIKDT